MGQFIVSARKYRPNSFETLIGQDNIARTLKNSILTGQLAHAYLFCGPRGVGKTSTARIFAKTINCSNPTKEMEPCGKCESCLSFAEGRSYCIHELDAASNNSIDDIRTLTEQVRIPPQIGKYSVYIIDEVHMLSQAAFNAFLKTLEEPPAHAIFILATTEKHKILPTILSRCQTYDFNRISVDDMVKNLTKIAGEENIRISQDALHIIAQKADGAMRDALTLFDQTVAFCGNDITYDQVIKNLNVLDYDYYFKLTDLFLQGDYAGALILFDEILSKGFNSMHFISGLSSHFRDLIVCKNATSKVLLELAPTIASKYDSYASKCSVNFIFNALDCTTKCEAAYKSSGNPRLLIEFSLMKLSGLENIQQYAVPVSAPASAPVEPATPAAQIAKTASTTTAAKKEPTAVKPSFSINEIMKKTMSRGSENAEATVKDIEDDCEITEELLEQAWKKLISLQTMPNITAELSRYKPDYSKELNLITQYFSNEARRTWMEHNLYGSVEDTYRRELHNSKVKLAFVTIPESKEDKENAKPYMPSEKAKAILENSEEMRQLRNDLDLEVS